MRRFLNRSSCAAYLAAIVHLALGAWVHAADDLGYAQLQNYLGGNAPNGAGVVVAQIEAPAGSDYAPNTSAAAFSGITFTFHSGASGTSSHADTVASNFYGSGSMAAGVTSVHLYEAGSWLTTGYLHTGTAIAPDVSPAKVQNHSWIGSFGNDAADDEALRRIDYAILRDQTIVVAGINNGSGTTVPRLMSSFYNGITVGVTSGNHSRSGTTFEGTGRIRPDIVAPAGATSFSTPLVSAAAAVLVQAAGATPNASRADVIKSVLLAGATKEEFGANWTHTHTQPLDLVFGAGEVNVFNSYKILEAGPQAPATNALAGSTGWSFSSVPAGGTQTYFFNVPNGYQLLNLSAILAWNRIVDNTLAAGLADLSLGLYSSSGFVLGSELDWSDSPVDNVEHIWRPGVLSAGEYALVVNSVSGGEPFALSWRSDLTAIPEPAATAILLGAAVIFLAARQRQRRAA